MPLVWAHAEFLKLLCARSLKRPLAMLRSVENHLRNRPAARGTWHWRGNVPFDTLPADRDLVIEMPAAFRLHLGFEGWQAIEDRSSTPLPFGWHGVALARSELARREGLDFTFYHVDAARLEGRDYHLRLAVSEKSENAEKAMVGSSEPAT